jgi:arabinose-5-phosphate isomerase
MQSQLNALSTRGASGGQSKVSILDPMGREARDCFRRQAAAIASLGDRLDDGAFGEAINLLLRVRGHVIVTGIGKSGLVGQKIAATLASTGTPSFFLHTTEALHGDLGAVTERDGVLVITYSGETDEVLSLLPHLRARGVPTVGLVGRRESTAARGVDVPLDVSVDEELCPHNLTPTNSTLAALAMGDALAVSLIRMRGFHEEDFARLHPGGSLGRQLCTVGDVMVRESLPVVSPDGRLADCVLAMARSRLPVVLVMDRGTFHGVVTEATLRGALEHDGGLERCVADVVDRTPRTVRDDAPLEETERRLRSEGLGAMVVVDDLGRVIGILNAEA